MPRKAKVTEEAPQAVEVALVADPAPIEPARRRLIAYADFSIDGYEFKAGEEFVPAYNFERDLEAEEARRGLSGLCFIKTIKKGEEYVRYILPLEEK